MKKNKKSIAKFAIKVLPFLFITISMIGSLTSCNNDEQFSIENEKQPEIKNNEKELLLSNFATILSKATYDRQDVREFLKKEAIKQFDKNYDILYTLIKNKKINGESFRNILIDYSSEAIIENIEKKTPLLNILIPQIPFFNLNPENLDCTDKEIPVAVSKKNTTSLYFKGVCTDNLKKGEIPDFYVFVVNENSRVMVKTQTRGGEESIMFKSPNYDGTSNVNKNPMTRTATVNTAIIGSKAIESYKHFYKDDASENSMALQRDYIYYGMTSQNQTGKLNRNVTEYISFIEINPTAYFLIADQKTEISIKDDPRIITNSVTQRSHDFTTERLIDALWTKGCYNLKIEVITSKSTRPEVVYIPLKPNDIWDFHLERSYRHSTGFRRSKYTYVINPNKFTAKRKYLNTQQISFGKWDLSEESIYRYINFVEEDEGITSSYSSSYELSTVSSQKVSGGIKVGLGIGKIEGSNEINAEASSSATVKKSKTVTITRTDKDDDLGVKKIYFYDPIIESKSGLQYNVHTYNTGIVLFGISSN